MLSGHRWGLGIKGDIIRFDVDNYITIIDRFTKDVKFRMKPAGWDLKW
jgi:hypothetical protein